MVSSASETEAFGKQSESMAAFCPFPLLASCRRKLAFRCKGQAGVPAFRGMTPRN
jgi:hypothetical protein